MAQSNAERQRAYRQRHLKDIEGGGERLNTVVSVSAKAQLARLAQYHGTRASAKRSNGLSARPKRGSCDG